MFLAWMVGSGKLNLHQIVGGISQRPAIVVMLMLLKIRSGITAWRRNLLLRAQQIRFLLPAAVCAHHDPIGRSFSVAIPGTVGEILLKGN